MTLLWLEGFDSFGTTNNAAPSPTGVVARKYSAITGESGMDIEAPFVTGSRSIENGSLGDRVIVTPALTTNTVMIAGCWFKFSNAMAAHNGGAYQALITFNEGTNRSLVLLQTASGLTVGRGNSEVWLGWTTRLKMTSLEWYFIEMKAFCHNSTGWVVVRVNGTTVLTVNNADTQNSTLNYYDRCRFSSYDVGTWWDHLYVADGAGSTNNDFLGPIFISPIRPDGDVSNGLAGGGYGDMDEALCDDGTTYATATSSGENIEMSYGATLAFDTVKGVMVSTTMSVDANTVYQHTSNDGSTLVNTANFSVNSTNINSYTTKCSLWETDPTGNAWTPSTVNSNAFGIAVQ